MKAKGLAFISRSGGTGRREGFKIVSGGEKRMSQTQKTQGLIEDVRPSGRTSVFCKSLFFCPYLSLFGVK